MAGPAFAAAIADVDPGNFATNIRAGAGYGYLLLWVALLACLAAMPIQYLSGKLGIVTGRDLAQACRRRYPRPVVWQLRGQAEIVAMATRLAEFTGAALALNLLFRLPVLPAALVTAVATVVLLSLRRQGKRSLQLVTPLLLAVVCAGLLSLVVRTGASGEGMLAGLRPLFADGNSVLLACGMIGATITPHALYLLSDLANGRTYRGRDRKTALRAARLDVTLALGLAGVVNLAIIVCAARLFGGDDRHDTIEATHGTLIATLGMGAAVTLAVALLASGVSSASVGTYVGQVVMRGFIGRTVPVWLRRAITIGTGTRAAGRRCRPDEHPGDQPGGPVLRHPVRARPAARTDQQSNGDGRASQQEEPITVVCGDVAAAIMGLNVFLLCQRFLG